MKPALSLVLTLAVVAGGCGSQEEDAVRDVIKVYLRAVADGDGRKACGQLTPAGQRELIAGVFGARRCDEAVRLYSGRLSDRLRERLRNPTIDEIEVRDSRATVHVKEIEHGALEKVDGKWKIAAEKSQPRRR